jgi:hypothetical protein
MNKVRIGFSLAVVAVVLAVSAAPVSADTVTYFGYGTPSDGSVDASATIVTTTNTVTITLTNLEENLASAGQEISGLTVDFSTALTSPTLTSATGPLTTINGNGSFSTPVSSNNNLTRWTANSTIKGKDDDLLALGGGKPTQLIIGPTNNDICPGTAGAGTYSKVTSDGNFNPTIACTATFVITSSGVTSNTMLNIGSVTFYFGTGPDSHFDGTTTPPVCEAGGVNCHAPTNVTEASTVEFLATDLGLMVLAVFYVRRKRVLWPPRVIPMVSTCNRWL